MLHMFLFSSVVSFFFFWSIVQIYTFSPSRSHSATEWQSFRLSERLLVGLPLLDPKLALNGYGAYKSSDGQLEISTALDLAENHSY